MNLIEGMERNSLILNTKGSEYYSSTYNDNLDVFTMMSRYNETNNILKMFNNALNENEDLALANLLYLLDIRNGKGERLLFKTIYKDLCLNNPDSALRILPFIGELGRFDYVLEGITTPIEDATISLIKEQLNSDIKSDHPSLLAKWLPSHRTHNENNLLAKKLIKKLNMSEKEYRLTLSSLRKKLNIVERNLTEKNYDAIDFEQVSTKAMIKYRNAYNNRMKEKYEVYKNKVKDGTAKINTTGLFSYEIIKNIINNISTDDTLYDLMWDNQLDFLAGNKTNILVMADTSGSMTSYNNLPLATSLGLALYTAERNKGAFANCFITFSSSPCLCKVKGKTIKEKVCNINCINECTDIDKAFQLILDTAVKNRISQKDMPSHLLIISDMEFDQGIYTNRGTNFEGWKVAFKEAGYDMPNIIFWNVAGNTRGVPVTKYDQDVCIVSGFSTNILENLLSLDKYTPTSVMMDKLSIYLEMLKA